MRPVVFLLIFALLVACKPGRRQSRDGRVLFETTCVQCHDVSGRGHPMWKERLGVPDLTDAALHERLSDEAIESVIRHGSKNGKMPAWGPILDDEQVVALRQHVRGFRPAR